MRKCKRQTQRSSLKSIEQKQTYGARCLVAQRIATLVKGGYLRIGGRSVTTRRYKATAKFHRRMKEVNRIASDT